MDDRTKSTIAYIVDGLRDELDHARSELSRLVHAEEATQSPGDNHGAFAAGDAQSAPQAPDSRFGVASVALHYTVADSQFTWPR